jgi:hypothetical protein
VFDRNPFIAQAPEYEVDKHCKIRKDRDGIPNHKKRAILEKYRLTSESHPAEWIGALLPDSAAPTDP